MSSRNRRGRGQTTFSSQKIGQPLAVTLLLSRWRREAGTVCPTRDKPVKGLLWNWKPKAPQAGAYYNRGVAYAEEGDYDRAIADCTQALRFEPGFAAAYQNLGLVYKEKWEKEEAIASSQFAPGDWFTVSIGKVAESAGS